MRSRDVTVVRDWFLVEEHFSGLHEQLSFSSTAGADLDDSRLDIEKYSDPWEMDPKFYDIQDFELTKLDDEQVVYEIVQKWLRAHEAKDEQTSVASGKYFFSSFNHELKIS